VLKALRKVLKQNRVKSVMDVGFGEGHHAFYLQRKGLEVRGIDPITDNVKFCNKYSASKNFTLGVIEDFTFSQQYDLFLLIGVLQYIENQDRALLNILNALTEKGRLIFYCPVNGRKAPLTDFIRSKFSGYDEALGKVRTYELEALKRKVEELGFKIESTIPSIGLFGKIGHEIYISTLLLFENWKFRLLLLPIFFFTTPLVVVFNFLDYLMPKKKYNGVVLILRKA
jgi:SAM-dependent methyltransferase